MSQIVSFGGFSVSIGIVVSSCAVFSDDISSDIVSSGIVSSVVVSDGNITSLVYSSHSVCSKELSVGVEVSTPTLAVSVVTTVCQTPTLSEVLFESFRLAQDVNKQATTTSKDALLYMNILTPYIVQNAF